MINFILIVKEVVLYLHHINNNKYLCIAYIQCFEEDIQFIGFVIYTNILIEGTIYFIINIHTFII